MQHRLHASRCDFEHRAFGARAPTGCCSVEIPVDALNQSGLRDASIGASSEGIQYRLESARCDLKDSALAARASANCSAVEISIGSLNQGGLRLTSIGTAREGIEDSLHPSRRDLEYGAFV